MGFSVLYLIIKLTDSAQDGQTKSISCTRIEFHEYFGVCFFFFLFQELNSLL